MIEEPRETPEDDENEELEKSADRSPHGSFTEHIDSESFSIEDLPPDEEITRGIDNSSIVDRERRLDAIKAWLLKIPEMNKLLKRHPILEEVFVDGYEYSKNILKIKETVDELRLKLKAENQSRETQTFAYWNLILKEIRFSVEENNQVLFTNAHDRIMTTLNCSTKEADLIASLLRTFFSKPR